MGFLQDFNNFAVKGNMLDLAVGVVIGAAFQNVIKSMVDKLIMPPLSLLTTGVNLGDKKWILRQAGNGMEQIVIGYGDLLQVGINFLIITFTIFVAVRGLNALRNKAEDPKDKTVETPKNIQLLSNIEELMKEQVELLRKMKE